MTIKLMVEGRGELRRKILQSLVEQAGGGLEVVLHFGDRDSDFHAACLSRMEVRLGRRGHLMKQHLSKGASIQLLAASEYQKMLEVAVEQLQRNAKFYRYRSHNLVGIQDYLDYYHILADAYAQEIERSGATHALFMNVPHLGHDIVLYQVACVMGLKTLVVSQTFFSDCYFSMARIEHFGQLNPESPNGVPVAIEKGSAPDLFYMEDRWQKKGPRGKLSKAAVLSLFRYILTNDPGKLLDIRYLKSMLTRISDIYGGLPEWRDPFAKFFHVNEMAYFEHLAQYEYQAVDFDTKFVYMPLHNQPEMSTQSLGGLFRDQLLAVEAIARCLPEGWRIYVKENPRQSAYARGPMFFHRLTRIKGVQLVPLETSTHDLSSRAQLTATICGTAGWEALRKGRPVVIFGGAWYRTFPGVFSWQDGLDLDAVAASSFSHAELENAAGRLQAACHPGVIEILYRDRAADLNEDENVRSVAQNIIGLLEERIPTTFTQA